MTGRSVAVLTRKEHIDIRDVAVSLIETLGRAGFKVYAVSPLKHDSAEEVSSIEDLKGLKPDILVTVGGDGTLLWVLREMDDETPVLGINVGGRGVLSEVGPQNVDEVVERLRDGRYVVEQRMRVSASIEAMVLPPALNEVYISRVSQTKTSTFNISIEGLVIRQKMDGVIVATPTGSTGHSMSFGGPFLHPSAYVFLLMSVGSINRLPPIVLPPEPVEVVSDSDSILVVDGQKDVLVKASEKITVEKYGRDARFIRFGIGGLRQLKKLGY